MFVDELLLFWLLLCLFFEFDLLLVDDDIE